MTFGEISDVVPWLETCEDLGIDVDAPQVAAPRLFKTHAWRPHLHTSKDAKYIVITRNPEDSAVSFYNFLNGWFFEKDSISMDTFLQRLFLKRGMATDEKIKFLFGFVSPFFFSFPSSVCMSMPACLHT